MKADGNESFPDLKELLHLHWSAATPIIGSFPRRSPRLTELRAGSTIHAEINPVLIETRVENEVCSESPSMISMG